MENNSNFTWDLKAALLTIWFVSTIISILSEAWYSASYTSFYLWVISLAVGYCVYMLSLLLGDAISCRIHHHFGENLSRTDKMLISNNLIKSINAPAWYESYRIYNANDETIKGIVIVAVAQKGEFVTGATEHQEVAQKLQDLVASLGGKQNNESEKNNS